MRQVWVVARTRNAIAPTAVSSFTELEREKMYRSKSFRNKDCAVGDARVAEAEAAMAASAVPSDATVERLAAKYAKDAIIKLQTGDKEVKGGKTQRVYGMVGLSDSDG